MNTSPTNEAITHNTYFDGNVQSLGLETDKGKATLGVMKKGTYQFGTSTTEEMVVVAGVMNVKLPEGTFNKYLAGEKFNVAANVTFDIICDTDVAYICYYGV